MECKKINVIVLHAVLYSIQQNKILKGVDLYEKSHYMVRHLLLILLSASS